MRDFEEPFDTTDITTRLERYDQACDVLMKARDLESKLGAMVVNVVQPLEEVRIASMGPFIVMNAAGWRSFFGSIREVRTNRLKHRITKLQERGESLLQSTEEPRD